MKRKRSPLAIALTLVAAASLPLTVTAQNQQKVNRLHHHYQLVQIPTLGGPGVNFFDNTNNIAVLNAHGTVSGGSADTLIPDPFSSNYWWNAAGNVTKAYLWQNGSLTELGSLLDNVNSGSAWISSNGVVAGLSENGQIDPSIPGLPQISPVIWRDGKITDLGTLPGGGYQGAAVSVNNRGEVAGVAGNLVPDANSLLNYNQNLWAGVGYGFQLRAFVWDQKNGMQDLGTLGTGTNAEATAINERGQIIGDSYTSSAPGVCYGVTTGGFLWDRRHGMLDLGSFGGTCTIPTDLNSHGQVAGISTVAGDSYQRAFLWEHGSLRDLGGFGGNNTGAIAINEKGEVVGFAQHAALWKHVGELIDLGTVGNDPCSFAQGINDKDQVVGDSSPSDCVNYDTSRGFLWEAGSIADLNTLIPPNSPLYVVYAYTINNRGEIAVNGIDANGIEQAAVLIPCDEDHSDVEGCDYSMVDADAEVRENPAPAMQEPTSTTPASVPPPPLAPTIRNLPGRFHFGLTRSPRPTISASTAALSENLLPEVCTRCCGFCSLLVLTPPSLTFPPQRVGTKSAPQTAYLSNRGTESASVPTISTAGPFSQTNSCPGVLRPHAGCQIHVEFLPRAKGTAHGTLSVGGLHTTLSGLGQ